MSKRVDRRKAIVSAGEPIKWGRGRVRFVSLECGHEIVRPASDSNEPGTRVTCPVCERTGK